jgi:Asp-tRNA(Asn)/Glu-tRNA(Gln) amidotransferase A subunit family amidase
VVVSATLDNRIKAGAARVASSRTSTLNSAGAPKSAETIIPGFRAAGCNFDFLLARIAPTPFLATYGLDVILTPVAERPATPHGTDAGWIPYTLPYSLTGWPCVVVRVGTDPAGLPIGVQVSANPWRDDVALAMAQAIERALGGWQPAPLA